MFENCKFAAWLKHDQRIPEPEKPLRPGQLELPNNRGTRVHKGAEDYVVSAIKTQLPEMRHFGAEFDHLRYLHTKGVVSLEGEWAVDLNWVPIAWQLGWHRSKLDAIVFPNEWSAIVIDYKTGRRFGNEVKHAEQTQLYALNAVLRYPKLEEVHTELWYLDQDELTSATFSRQQVLRLKTSWDRRGKAMTSAKEFPPNPNIHSCRWCRYGTNDGGTGHCKVGVWR
jgi:hypothetical protein